MKKTTHVLLLAAMIAVGFASSSAADEQPARYIVILNQRSSPTPDVAKLGGTVEFRKDEELIITLPAASLERFKTDPAVKYVQRVGASGAASAPATLPEPTPDLATPPRFAPAAEALRPEPTGANPWNSGAYVYDGAGNITRIGTQSFAYDQAQRVAQAKIDGVLDAYNYDAFGNMTSKTVGGQTQSIPAVASSSNRAVGYSYDEAGNVLTDGAWTFTYDAAGQPLTESYNNANFSRNVYTAGDERIGVLKSGWWFWSLRDESGKVLRQFRSVDGNPSVPLLWVEDFVWRDGLLLGAERPVEMGGRRHFHLDHLGTPRLITGDTGSAVSFHDYYPFGEEKTLVVQETANGFDREDPMKFTGHERDFAGGQGAEDSHYIDYMHARFYGPGSSRFFSPDPVLGNLLRPQSWNRYAYVLNSPVDFMDPYGLKQVQPGQKLEPGDTCNGTVIDGWCTGEIITVEADGPSWYDQARAEWEAYRTRKFYEYRGSFSNISWRDAPILRKNHDVPCKSYWGRFAQSEIDTNGLPGLTAPTGTGLITAARTAQATRSITLGQWARSGFGGATMGEATFTATETGMITGMTALTNFALVSIAWESGVAVGSAINAAFTDGCD